MGEVQLWQADGLGTNKETLEKVLRIFRSDGVQGIESQQALNGYIEKLSNDSLQNMYEIDEDRQAGTVQKHTGKWSASMRNARKS